MASTATRLRRDDVARATHQLANPAVTASRKPTCATSSTPSTTSTTCSTKSATKAAATLRLAVPPDPLRPRPRGIAAQAAPRRHDRSLSRRRQRRLMASPADWISPANRAWTLTIPTLPTAARSSSTTPTTSGASAAIASGPGKLPPRPQSPLHGPLVAPLRQCRPQDQPLGLHRRHLHRPPRLPRLEPPPPRHGRHPPLRQPHEPRRHVTPP